MAVPIAVMTLIGHPILGYIAGSGAFTVLFAGAAPVVERARVLPVVALPPLVYIVTIACGCIFSYAVALSPLVIRRVRSHPARPLRELLPGPAFDETSRMLVLRAGAVRERGAACRANGRRDNRRCAR